MGRWSQCYHRHVTIAGKCDLFHNNALLPLHSHSTSYLCLVNSAIASAKIKLWCSFLPTSLSVVSGQATHSTLYSTFILVNWRKQAAQHEQTSSIPPPMLERGNDRGRKTCLSHTHLRRSVCQDAPRVSRTHLSAAFQQSCPPGHSCSRLEDLQHTW